MIDLKDKEIYFPRSFNEQMTWIDEEVERIIKYNKTRQTKKKIQEQGKAAYGQIGYTHAINRMFEIIKVDPKNKALIREVNRAEQELIAFLYDEPDALSEKEIFTYWNNYMWAYVAELESQHVHYFIMRGYEEVHDDEWIGIYHAWHLARDAYNKAAEQLKEEHQKIMVHIFDETTGKWNYDVDPKLIFKNRTPADREKHKEIECVIDSAEMCLWKSENVRKDLEGYFYDDSPNKFLRRNGEESILVRFEIEHTYQAFDFLDEYWGDFNACPDCRTMKEKAREWHDRYGAELVRISHDSLTFQCRKLSVEEAEEIIAEASGLHAEIIDCKPDKLVEHMTRESTFTLWWD